MLPFGVVIPTKNSMKYVPDHVQTLSTWIDLAEQVVVVDSFSKDGTVDYIKKNLHHPNIIFVNHPPGLYASWNHGIRQLKTEYCYISTVGDSLTRLGVEHFVSAASRLQCDVLVSTPNFITEAGQPCAGPEWPMCDIVKTLRLKEPRRLAAGVIVAAALAHTGGAITGSCASDLFRTVILQQFPFPLDFGMAGDGAWSLQNAARLKWAVTLEKITTFRLHPPTASAREIREGEVFNRFSEMATEVIHGWMADNSTNYPEQTTENMKRLLFISIEYEQRRRQYNSYRKGHWPWSLNPAAWQARMRRNQLKRQTHDLMESICRASSGSLR